MRISASSNCVFWKTAIGRPNALRSLHVLERPAERGLGGGDAADRDRQPLLRQVVDQVREALALDAEQVADRHLHVGEEQLGGVLGVQADLVEVAAALEAVHAPLDHEQAHARVPLASGRSSPR